MAANRRKRPMTGRHQSPHPVAPLIPPMGPRALMPPSVNPQTIPDFRNRYLGRCGRSAPVRKAAALRTVPRKGSDELSETETRRKSREAIVLASRRAGKLLREVAVDLYGPEQVDADWRADSRLRLKVRRLLYRDEARSGAGPGRDRRRAARETPPRGRRRGGCRGGNPWVARRHHPLLFAAGAGLPPPAASRLPARPGYRTGRADGSGGGGCCSA